MPVIFERGALGGEIAVPGDKSISHRALMLGAVARGKTRIHRANRGEDVLATRDVLRALGVRIEEGLAAPGRGEGGEDLAVYGGRLCDPNGVLDARNSGTTARLMLGLCAGAGIHATFDGDASLRGRPMERVARPLRAMGAQVETSDGRLPATVRGVLHPPGGAFRLELPSAQLKSTILLAHLGATGDVHITGDAFSRDHTERMLRHFGRAVEFDGRAVTLHPGGLTGAPIYVPGDLSAAAAFVVGAVVTPGSEFLIRAAGVNPTRTGFLDALCAMGASLSLTDEHETAAEPVADIRAKGSSLRAIDIDGELVVRAIDEIPLLAVAAAFAEGVTHIRGAADLRTKESDRLSATASMLRACGVEVREYPDGLDVVGGTVHPPSQTLGTLGDHRLAMAAAVLGAAAGPVTVDDERCAAISFPGFSDAWARAQAAHLPT